MIVEVTHEDIKIGQKAICDLCPVARAVKRALAGPWLVAVRPPRVYVWVFMNAKVKQYLIPETVQQRIRCFDAGAEMHPFSFELTELPGESH
jgi:hypothetical protein